MVNVKWVYKRLELLPRNPSFKKHYAKRVSLFSNECEADSNGGKKSQSENELGVLTGKPRPQLI